jgi:Peptidase family M23
MALRRRAIGWSLGLMRIPAFARISAALVLASAFAVACAGTEPVQTTTGTGSGGQGGEGATTSAGGAGGRASSTTGNGGSRPATTVTTTGAGGATSTSTATSTASATTGSGSSDPCSGYADGDYCGGDLGGLADHSSTYHCAGGATQSATPCPSGCSGGACAQPPADPCASAMFGNGAYCGGTLTGGDASALYDCQNGGTASKTNCPAGCKVNPPGVADACNPQGDPCAGAMSGDGAYCGSGLPGGDPSVLYTCQNKATASSQTCTAGCQVNNPGVPDTCKPAGGGACCVNHPPGVVTQPFTACGNGGSHYGIDYGTAIGTDIYAGIAGTVVGSALGFPNCYNNGCNQACWNAFNYVKIKSDCGDPSDGSKDLFVYYLHINDLAPGIANGSHVDQGQLVAHSGNSGCSSGPHIHIEAVSVPKGSSAVLNTCASVNPASRYCP